MVQPYLADVDARGEAALVYLDGAFSHAITKGAMLAPAAVNALDPGYSRSLYRRRAHQAARPRAPPNGRSATGSWPASASASGELLYARVDLLPTPDGPGDHRGRADRALAVPAATIRPAPIGWPRRSPPGCRRGDGRPPASKQRRAAAADEAVRGRAARRRGRGLRGLRDGRRRPRRLGLPAGGRRGGDGRRPRRLVRGHRAVPASARPADPAHRDHPAQEGPDRTGAGRLRPAELPQRSGRRRAAAGGRDPAAGRRVAGDPGHAGDLAADIGSGVGGAGLGAARRRAARCDPRLSSTGGCTRLGRAGARPGDRRGLRLRSAPGGVDRGAARR